MHGIRVISFFFHMIFHIIENQHEQERFFLNMIHVLLFRFLLYYEFCKKIELNENVFIKNFLPFLKVRFSNIY